MTLHTEKSAAFTEIIETVIVDNNIGSFYNAYRKPSPVQSSSTE
jgi:hypothetical protein